MQNLSKGEIERINSILISDRQWRREERIKHSKYQLRWAKKYDPEMVPIRLAILRRLDYDYVDKVNAKTIDNV